MPNLDDRISTGMGEEPGFLHALRVLRERWWLLVACAGAALIAAILYTHGQVKEYTATSKLQFTPNSIPSQVAGVPQPQAADPEGEKATDLQLVTATPVAKLVVRTLHLNMSASEVLEDVSASNAHDDYIIAISATDTKPARAAQIANAFAQQYVVYSQQENEAQLIKGEQLINQKLESLPATDTVDRGNLKALYQKLLLLQAVQTGNARVVGTASVPSSPSSPKTTPIYAVGLIAGLLVGTAFAFLMSIIDRRIKSLEEFEELLRVPALASVPRLPRGLRIDDESEVHLEPFRILRNGLGLVTPRRDVKTVLVTSSVAGEGKTTVALGLALASARSGERVILVEADLRHPSFAARLGLSHLSPQGLTSALFDGRDPRELLSTPLPELERLRVLSSGRVRLQATDLTQSARLHDIFASLAGSCDLMVIDSAPLLPVVDTRTLLDEVDVDVCLIISRMAMTTRDQARRVRTLLDRRQLHNVGLVVNELAEIGGSYEYYEQDKLHIATLADGVRDAHGAPRPANGTAVRTIERSNGARRTGSRATRAKNRNATR